MKDVIKDMYMRNLSKGCPPTFRLAHIRYSELMVLVFINEDLYSKKKYFLYKDSLYQCRVNK